MTWLSCWIEDRGFGIAADFGRSRLRIVCKETDCRAELLNGRVRLVEDKPHRWVYHYGRAVLRYAQEHKSTLSELVNRALARLRKLDEYFVSKGYKPLVLFSGGKDSLVVLDLVHRYFGSDFYVAYIHVNGNTHEECDYYVLCTVEKYLNSPRRFYYLYRDFPVTVLGRVLNNPDFFEIAKLWGLPGLIRNRWCMRIFKIEVLRES